jgi:ABC-2 type transport system ATP-binding protein
MNSIEIEQLGLQKKKSLILNRINLELHAGQSYLLYGKNGAGKTSLLRCLSGLEKGFKGNIFYNGEVSHEQLVTYLPDTYSLHDSTVIGKYIQSFRLLLESNGLFDEERFNQAYDMFNIHSFRDKNFGSLSKGMIKMVFITITLMKTSNLIVLDEPFEGLDITMKNSLLELLIDDVTKGKILIVSSHEVAEIYKKFDQLIGIKGGGITSILNREEVFDYKDLIHQIL